MALAHKNLFVVPLFAEGAKFTTREQEQRGRQILAELKVIFPELDRVSDSQVGLYYGDHGGRTSVFVDLIAFPQERLKFNSSQKRGTQADNEILDEMAQKILASVEETQEAIYREVYQANAGDSSSTTNSCRTQHEAMLHSLMRQHRNEVRQIETSSGQIRIDFPDYCAFRLTEEPIRISGIVGRVEKGAIELLSIRKETDSAERIQLPTSGQRKWVYLPDRLDRESITLAAHSTSYRPKPLRLCMDVKAAINPLTLKVNHFVLEDGEGLLKRIKRSEASPGAS